MKPDLYTRVVLTRDIAEYNLRQGDVAMYVDHIATEHKEDGAILEIFNALGDSLRVVTVPISAIAPLQANQVITVRALNSNL